MVSNLNPDTSAQHNSIDIYDSMFMTEVSKLLKKEICSFVKPLCEKYSFDIMSVQTQTNGLDCRLFLIACTTELVHLYDPVVCHCDGPLMKNYLMKCLEEQHFPVNKQWRVRFGQKVRKSETAEIYLCVECMRIRGEWSNVHSTKSGSTMIAWIQLTMVTLINQSGSVWTLLYRNMIFVFISVMYILYIHCDCTSYHTVMIVYN